MVFSYLMCLSALLTKKARVKTCHMYRGGMTMAPPGIRSGSCTAPTLVQVQTLIIARRFPRNLYMGLWTGYHMVSGQLLDPYGKVVEVYNIHGQDLPDLP